LDNSGVDEAGEAEAIRAHLQDERWISENRYARNGWRWSTSWMTSKRNGAVT